MKTFKALYIDNGIIKAGEFPVEPEYCTLGVQDQCEKRDVWVESLHSYTCSCRAKEVEHQKSLASAKANAVECEDQKDAQVMIQGILANSNQHSKLGTFMSKPEKLDGEIFPLPSGWDYRVEEQLVISSRVKEGAPIALKRKYRKGAKLYRTDEQPEPEESQEALWNEAEGIIAEAMGTYKTALTVALGSYARKELEKHFTITRRK